MPLIERWSIVVVLGTAVLLLGFFWWAQLTATGGEPGVPLDDAWIHYQFARNISQGHGFSYNPGQPTPGSTAPLWTMLLAGVGLFTEAFILPSQLLSAFFLLATIYAAYGLTRSLTGDVWPALLAALGVALTGRLLWAGLSGMEVTLFTALSVTAVWVYHRQGMRWPAALLFGLAAQVRPEAHLLFALAVGDVLLRKREEGRRKKDDLISHFSFLTSHSSFLIPLLLAGAIYAAVNAPYALFSLSVTGRPLPNTFYAKSSSDLLFSLRTLQETAAFHWQDNGLAFLLALAGLWPLWRRSRLATAWLAGLFLAMPFIVPQLWHHGRYTMPLIPFQMIAAAVGAHWLWQSVQDKAWSRFTPRALLWLSFIIAGLWHLPYWAQMLADNTKEIQDVDVAMALWLAENTPPEALIAVDDIGAIGFLSGRRLFDLNGLISPEMWPVIEGEARGRPVNEATTRLLSHIQPDYLAIFPEWHWEIATNPLVVEEAAMFVAETKTIIGEQRAFVYRVRQWPYLAAATPQIEKDTLLGDAIRLLGVDIAVENPLQVTLYWQSVQAVEVSYDVFIHVQDAEGQIVAQSDGAPVGLLAPTHRWQPGDVVRDPHLLTLPEGLANGRYAIRVGMYLRETGERLPVQSPDATENAILVDHFSW